LYGAKINGLPDNCYYLDGESIEIEGLKFHGIPLFMEEIMDGTYDKLIDNIPTDTDVLITHQPPTDIFSGDFGDYFLTKKVNQIKPQYHLFGHAHEQYGKIKMGKTTYVNAALVSNHYEMLFKPILIEL
jgi:Icc-related predicted phosphoesterase